MLRQFNDLIQILYRNDSEQPSWRTFLGQLKSVTRSNLVVLYIGQPSNYQYHRLQRTGVYAELPDPVYQKMLSLSPFNQLPANQVLSLEDLHSRRALVHSDFYRHCMLPHDIHHMLGANLYDAGRQIGYLRIVRGSSGSRYGAREKSLCSLLLPHIGNALHWRTLNQAFEGEKALLNRVLDCLEIGKLVVDGQAGILEINDTARQLLSRSGALMCQNGYLKAVRREENQWLRQSLGRLAEVADAAPGLAGNAFVFRDSRGQQSLQMLAARVQGGHEAGAAAQRIVLFVTAMEHEVRLDGDLLSELFGLTPSESAIAIALAKGLSVEDAAHAGNITLNTARTHIRSAFNKLGVTQQSMLVSRVLTSVARFG